MDNTVLRGVEDPARAWRRGAFAPLASPAYRRLWAATLLQFVGLVTINVVRGYLAFDLTGSNTAVAGLLFGFGIAMFPAMFWAGVVTDRFPKRTVLGAAQLLLAAQALLLGGLALGGLLAYWMLFAQALLEGVAVAFLVPSRQAMNGRLLEARDVGRGVVLQQGSMGLARVFGPVAGGLLVAAAAGGAAAVFLGVGALYFAGAVLTFRIPCAFDGPGGDGAGFRGNLEEGLRYVRRRPSLLVIVLVAYIVAFTAAPWSVFLPGLVAGVFGGGAFELGLINAAAAVGAVAIAGMVAAIATRPSAWEAFLAVSLLFGLLVAALGLAPNFALALLAAVLVGGAEMGFTALALGLGMVYSHRLYDGRVQALIVSSFSLFGVASLPLGLLGDAIGVREAFVAEGAAGVLLMLLAVRYARRVGARADARAPAADAPPPEEEAPLPAPDPSPPAAEAPADASLAGAV